MGMLPDSLGAQDTITWIPVDTLADIIVELIFSDSASTAEPWTVFHNLVSPRSTTWRDLLPAVKSQFPPDTKVVLYETWLKALQESKNHTADEDVSANPAVKLLDFFEGLRKWGGMPEMAVEETIEKSATMAGLAPVKGEWMGRWIDGWEVQAFSRREEMEKGARE